MKHLFSPFQDECPHHQLECNIFYYDSLVSRAIPNLICKNVKNLENNRIIKYDVKEPSTRQAMLMLQYRLSPPQSSRYAVIFNR